MVVGGRKTRRSGCSLLTSFNMCHVTCQHARYAHVGLEWTFISNGANWWCQASYKWGKKWSGWNQSNRTGGYGPDVVRWLESCGRSNLPLVVESISVQNISFALSPCPSHTTYSPPCCSFKCKSVNSNKHYKLPSASHMVSDTSACRWEGGVPDTHSTVLQWDNSSAIPTGGQYNSTHGGHCPWNGVPGDCISLQPGWK